MRTNGHKGSSLKKFFAAKQRITRRRLRDALDDPSERNIHDLRTSIRRLQAAYLLLPKEHRKFSELSEYMSCVRQVIREYNLVRDSDVLRLNVVRHLKGVKMPRLLAAIEADRERGLTAAFVTGSKLQKLDLPRFPMVALADLQARRRFEKVYAKLSKRIKKNLKATTRDESLVEELHKLRIDSKMLRYVLEATGTDRREDPIARFLKDTQDTLGAIHDCDVAVAYVSRHSKAALRGPLGESLKAERASLFRKFVRDSKKTPLN